VKVEEALFIGYYVERGVPHHDMPARQIDSRWHWHGFARCLSESRLRDDLNALMLNLREDRRVVWIDCSEAEHPAGTVVPPVVRVLPYKGLTTLAETKKIIDGIPQYQWINVMLGVRYSMTECLTEQRDLIGEFRNPIVRANEIRQLVQNALP